MRYRVGFITITLHLSEHIATLAHFRQFVPIIREILQDGMKLSL